MSNAVAKKQLSDGRAIRALDVAYTQEQMFKLFRSGIFDPAAEKIMGVKDHVDSLNVSKVWKKISVNGWWRTDRYAAYRRGFEKENLPVGDKITYIEDGVSYTFEIPKNMPVIIVRPDGSSETIDLQKATGMLDFDLAKLSYDPEARIVSVASDFNPETDVRVVDVMRPRNWALVDANGYPLKSMPSGAEVSDARYSYIRHVADFGGESTGYHGSVSIDANFYCGYDFRRYVHAFSGWHGDCGVALVGHANVASGTVPLV